MQTEKNLPPGELLRRTMRHWVTGVSIVTSRVGDVSHGMTVNSFGSISIDPPVVTVTMNTETRTSGLVLQSGVFAVTILSQPQLILAEMFAGRVDAGADRMTGVDTFAMITGAPLLTGGLGFLDCRVIHQYPMLNSTLFIAEVLAAQPGDAALEPLVYYNRVFTRLA